MLCLSSDIYFISVLISIDVSLDKIWPHIDQSSMFENCNHNFWLHIFLLQKKKILQDTGKKKSIFFNKWVFLVALKSLIKDTQELLFYKRNNVAI